MKRFLSLLFLVLLFSADAAFAQLPPRVVRQDLATPVTVPPQTVVTLITQPMTMPPFGCPCRVRATYNIIFVTNPSTRSLWESWVNDQSNPNPIFADRAHFSVGNSVGGGERHF